MDKRLVAITYYAAIVLAAAAVVIILVYGLSMQVLNSPYKTFTIGERSFNITAVATTQSQQERGLMNTTITNSTIMLFAFKSLGDYPFWMYDTYSNLDIMWVSYGTANGTVVYVARNATSCFARSQCAIYDPGVAANYVIEAKAGFAGRNNVTIGTAVEFR